MFLSTGFIKAIDRLHPSESAALLDYLNEELAGHADYQVRFRWTPDAVALWDNRSTAHFGAVRFKSRLLVGEPFNVIS